MGVRLGFGTCNVGADPEPALNGETRMRVQKELMRGAGPVAVLGLLEVREMYGYELVEALSRETDGVLAMGQSTLYPLLYNLERKKLIHGSWEDAESGRRRKYYQLTKKGARWLRAQEDQWKSLVAALNSLGILGSGPAKG